MLRTLGNLLKTACQQRNNPIQPRDDDSKYLDTDGLDQLDVALIGTCISPKKLQGSEQARNENDNDLHGIIQDGEHMYTYFKNNGAKISLYAFETPAVSASALKKKIKRFIMAKGNNKFLYFTGHANTDGDIVFGPRNYLSARTVFQWLSDCQFCGHITIMVDSCYSGRWAEILISTILSYKSLPYDACCTGPWKMAIDRLCNQPSAVLAGVQKATNIHGSSTSINLRLSSLADEKSLDLPEGGNYTSAALNSLRKEWAWTKQNGRGWGTKMLTQSNLDETSAVFRPNQSAQTDLSINFVYPSTGGNWAWFCPNSRERFAK